MSVCKMCRDRGKDWEGDDPRCAFASGAFSPENWNCATMNVLREAIGDSFFSEGDQNHATIPLNPGHWPDTSDDEYPPLALWLTWYKRRGCTEAAWLLFESAAPRPPTEDDIRHIAATLMSVVVGRRVRDMRKSMQ